MPNHIPAAIPVGTIISGKYRVERHVGDGGMGLVVAARHLVLKELYAIKFMHHHDLANPQAAERFLREAQAVAKLKNNAHVARVHDVGRHETGDLFIVMELLEGQDLGDVLKTHGVLSVQQACSYILQACNALVEAHDLGIIHRDLKPANLFLTRLKDGSSCIKVLDFGISKILNNEGQESAIEMTGSREMMGSPLYMSPEQARSARDVDVRTDIWALGAILYKLLTGKAPFTGATVAEVSFALLEPTSVQPPSEIRRDIPLPLEMCILRCLEKNVHRRYRRVTDLMAALAPFATPQSPTPEDDDNAATVFRPIGNNRTNQDRFGGTLPLSAMRSASLRRQEAPPRQERSGTDVMPAYPSSRATRDDLMQASPAALDAQTTQPLDARALHALSNERRAMDRKPSFTERVMLPPTSSMTPMMPPPIPPAYPTGGYPLAPAARITLQSAATSIAIPDITDPSGIHTPSKTSTPNHSRFIVPIVVGTVVVGVLIAMLGKRILDRENRARLETTTSASVSVGMPYSRPAPSASVLAKLAIPSPSTSGNHALPNAPSAASISKTPDAGATSSKQTKKDSGIIQETPF